MNGSQEELYTGHEEPEFAEEDLQEFYDDISGHMRPADALRNARVEEVEYLRRFPVYEKVPSHLAVGE